MSTHKNIDKICCAVLAVIVVITVLFMNGELLGVQVSSASPAYESKLFDTSKVHSIDIHMDDWDSFIETCTNEEYTPCTVIIDGDVYKNVAIRAKGNTSLSSVKSYDNDRYSFKIEFDGYDSGKNYYGLDKLCLNNIIQDNTYMKDYLVYQMMNEFGAAAPLSSYAAISVNGEYFGLYLAVEGVEESFLERNYGSNYGELYKPDSMGMGGGRGNGKDFDPSEFESENAADTQQTSDTQQSMNGRNNMGGGKAPGGMGSAFGKSDVSLLYSDDEFSSYSNIFDSAKTDVTDSDKERLIASLKRLNENTDIENTVDIEAVIRYFVVHNFAVNFDSYTGSMIHNYYLYEDDGRLSMIPWDYNLAFGGFESHSDAANLINYPIDSPVSGGTIESRPMLAWIFESEEYTEMYHELFAEFIESYFDSNKFEDEITAVSEMIAPYIESDPTKFCTYEEFETGIATLQEFCLLRAESISGQLDGTIPSTSEGQSADTSALISASDLSVPAMGSMNHGEMGSGERGAERTQAATTSFTTTNLSAELPSEREMPTPQSNADFPGNMQGENRPQGELGSQRPDRGNMQPNMQMPFEEGNFSGMQNASPIADNNLVLLCVSAAVLILGLVIAFKFKR